MKTLQIHLTKVGADRVRLYQDGFKEQVFTLAQLDQALAAERDFERLIALQEAREFLAPEKAQVLQ